MQLLFILITLIITFLGHPQSVLAATDQGITSFTNDTLSVITSIAASAVVLFLIRGGYLYITSTGKPDALEHAKTTIRNALVGLTLILSSTVLVTILTHAMTPDVINTQSTTVTLTPINTVPGNGVTQIFIATMTGFMQEIVQSATKPLVDAIFGFLIQTPSVLQNATIHNFWLVILGITDSLYVIVIALVGLHIMSAQTFGFDEISLKQVLPRIGLSFLGANTSLALVEYVITTNNVLVQAVLRATGGLDHAWVVDAISFPNIASDSARLVTLLFFILFLIVAIVLLLFYVTRLILISLASVLSPLIFLLWALPKTADFAEIATKTFLTTVFIEFVHVVIIQLASAFLALPANPGNSLLSIVIAIGLFATLLKIPSFMLQMVFYSSRNKTFKALGGQFINVISSKREEKGPSYAKSTFDRKASTDK